MDIINKILKRLLFGPNTIRFRKWVIVSLSILIAYGLISFLTTPHGVMVDSPSFIEMKDSILSVDGYPDTTKYTTIFYDIWPEHASGGYSYIEGKNMNDQISYGGENIKICNGYFVVDNLKYTKGKIWVYKTIRIGLINPWWYYNDLYNLSNLGYPKGYLNRDSTVECFKKNYLILHGNYLSDEKFNYLTLLLFIFLIFVLLANILHYRTIKRTGTNLLDI